MAVLLAWIYNRPCNIHAEIMGSTIQGKKKRHAIRHRMARTAVGAAMCRPGKARCLSHSPHKTGSRPNCNKVNMHKNSASPYKSLILRASTDFPGLAHGLQ
jgi:hypothetical protein